MMLKRINAATVNAIATAIRSMLMRFWGVVSGLAILSSILFGQFWYERLREGQNKTHAGFEHCCVGSCDSLSDSD
jgi:hypothetical protein